jgi:hypothetical protein
MVVVVDYIIASFCRWYVHVFQVDSVLLLNEDEWVFCGEWEFQELPI